MISFFGIDPLRCGHEDTDKCPFFPDFNMRELVFTEN